MISPEDSQRIATALLNGDDVPDTYRPLVADSYAILALYVGPESAKDVGRELAEYLDRRFGAGVLSTRDSPIRCLLIPTLDQDRVDAAVHDLHLKLNAPAWMAVTRRRRTKIASGRQEARDVTAVAVASGRPPGLYRVADMPVEYAALGEPTVLSHLIQIITPVADRPVLRTTLKSVIAAEGNRSKAATDLGVHRSTLDYRLNRIGDLTGKDPTSAPNLQLLAVALVCYSAVYNDYWGPGFG